MAETGGPGRGRFIGRRVVAGARSRRRARLYCLVPPDSTVADLPARWKLHTEALCAALARSGIPHAVFLSSFGAHLDLFPMSLYHDAESAFRRLRTRFTLLRPPYFMENTLHLLPAMKQGMLPSLFTPDRRLPMIAVRDIGEAAVRALLDPPEATRPLEISGPVEYSMSDVAQAYSRALRKPVGAQRVPEAGVAAFAKQAGFSDEVARFYRAMVAAFETGAIHFESASTVARGATTLDRFVERAIGSGQL